jgi:molecular chaperone DnaJ
MVEQVNYYEVLGVSRAASQTEIRNAYRNLAKDRHPDRPGGNQEEFALLQEAHAVLSDPNRRRQHDEALDLAHAADQLASLEMDFGSLEDELSSRRRESGGATGPGLGERLRNRFGRKEAPPRGSPSGRGRGRGRYQPTRETRWYEVQDFDPEPITWRSAAICFIVAFVAFIAVGQLGRWATGIDVVAFASSWAPALGPFMPILYTMVGLVASYFAFRTAGYAAVALVFVAALVVGGSGGPEGLVQFGALGVAVLLGFIYLGKRRDEATRR